MTSDTAKNYPAPISALLVLNDDKKRAWFACALPGVMALLLALVPILRTAAIGPFLFVLIPLVIWSAFRDTERAIYVYIAWCWIDGVIRGLFHSDPISIVARDLVLGVIVVGWSFQRLQNRDRDPVRWPPGSLLIVLFVINCLLQVFSPYSLGLVQNIAGLKLHLSTIPLFFLAYDTIRRREQVRSLFLFLTLATLVIGILTFVQYVQGQSWTWDHFPGTKEVISQNLHATEAGGSITVSASFKPPGATGFGGGTGIFIGFVIPLTFALLLLSEKIRFAKLFKAGLLGTMLAFIVFIFINGVRSGLVIAAAGVIISAALTDGKLRARMLTAIAVCGILALIAWSYSQNISQGGVTDRFSSTFANPVTAMHQDRQTFFDDVGSIVTRAPMGVGLGRVGPAAGRLGSSGKDLGFSPGTEAYVGSVMYETGIIGGILITSIALSFLVRGYRALIQLQDADSKLLTTAILSILVVIFANFFVTPILLGPPGSVLFWLLAGVLLRAQNSFGGFRHQRSSYSK